MRETCARRKVTKREEKGSMPTSNTKGPEQRLESQSLNLGLSDNEVKNCNRLFWLKDEHVEAIRIWKLGKEVGFLYTGEEEVVIGHLQSLKLRNNSVSSRASISRVEDSISDDEVD